MVSGGAIDADPDCEFDTAAGDFKETYVLSRDIYQIEMLTNLDLLPEWGSLVVASWPKPYKGSGFPARVFAILP